MKNTLPTIAAAIALFLLPGCYEVETRVVETIDRTWEAEDLETLDLESVNGRIEISATDAETVRVHAEVRSSYDNQKDVVRFETSGDVLEIREKWKRRRGGIFPFSRGSGGSVRYEIEV
ncbi:MAG: hypothetical protein R3338_05685, partial [Thermoanaerobaculia bacterium]|nr:hypothetical protein [Thermoanaerobaculia bacterium]